MLERLSTPNNIKELAVGIQSIISTSVKYAKFQRMYENDRIAFAYDILGNIGRRLTFYQEEILGLFDDGYHKVSVRGPHGLGKTFMAALLVHHTVLTAREDAKVPTTASAWRQLEKYLWPEISKLSKFLQWSEIGREPYDKQKEFLQLSIRIRSRDVEAFAVASDDHTTIEGAHARLLFYVFDEAKTIPRPTWDAAEGAFATGDSFGKLKSDKTITNKQLDLVSIESVNDISRLEISESNNVIVSKSNSNYKSYNNDVEYLNGVKYDKVAGSIGGVSESDSDVRSNRNEVVSESGGYGEMEGSSSESPIATPASPIVPAYKESSHADMHTNAHAHAVDLLDRPDEAYAFAISTPGIPSGQFYDIQTHKPGYEDWITKHVTLDDAIRAGRINKEWAEQRAKQWGTESSVYMNRVLGEFAETAEEGMIPLSWVRAAVERWKTWTKNGRHLGDGKRTLGIDTARSGYDKAVIAERHLLVIENIRAYSKLSTTYFATIIQGMAEGRAIHIEMDGIGATIYDILHSNGVRNLRPITVGAGTTWRDKSGLLAFANVRAAMWWHMRDLLNPEYGHEVCIPPIEELVADLSTPMYLETEKNVILLESKDSIRERLGRSTDYGDSVCLAFWELSSGGGVVF